MDRGSSQVANSAAREVARSPSTSSQGASSPGRQPRARRVRACQVAGTRSLSPGRWKLGRWLAGRRSRAHQVAGWPAIYASWRRLIGLLGRKV
ncbi:UNVERIFIED_CONTAM: hypothetical protein Slati_3719800 [Sesamum latifolium]|uniref:Uncharacterized protein n=1 Tax=Sesamum latifolium TaxID=2727402 RepID=A0AAW2U6B9_9LAMI